MKNKILKYSGMVAIGTSLFGIGMLIGKLIYNRKIKYKVVGDLELVENVTTYEKSLILSANQKKLFGITERYVLFRCTKKIVRSEEEIPDA